MGEGFDFNATEIEEVTQVIEEEHLRATPVLAGQQSIVEQLLVTFDQRVNLGSDVFNIS